MLDQNVHFRPGTVEDGPGLKELYRLTVLANAKGSYPQEDVERWSTAFNLEAWPQRLQDLTVIVAEVGNELAGVASFDSEECLVQTCYVHPRFNRQGIGRQPLGLLEAKAKSTGCQQVTLDASLNAVPFYEKCGYRAIEREIRIYGERPFVVVKMAKSLA